MSHLVLNFAIVTFFNALTFSKPLLLLLQTTKPFGSATVNVDSTLLGLAVTTALLVLLFLVRY